MHGSSAPVDERWYSFDAHDIADRLVVDVKTGLSTQEAAARLKRDGPNSLPVESQPSHLRRLLGEYTSFMQLILVGASIVSLAIKQWSTAIVLVVISLFNALVGLRQAGKAESAMNALQSMMKSSAGSVEMGQRRSSRRRMSSPATSSSSRPVTRSRPMGGSSARARCRSTSRH